MLNAFPLIALGLDVASPNVWSALTAVFAASSRTDGARRYPGIEGVAGLLIETTSLAQSSRPVRIRLYRRVIDLHPFWQYV